MQRLLLIVLILNSKAACSQLSALSKYETCWAVFHPFAALKVKKITRQCYAVYNQPVIKQQLDSFAGGGKLDAFRHTFFMAAYAQKIHPKKLRKLGMAHEKGNYRQFLHAGKEEGETPDSLSSVMDLKNNALGVCIGKENKKASLEELKQRVITDIKNGQAVIIKRNSSGAYVDCGNHVIDLKKFQRSWNIPKCLVASDK